ncbi:hypothetical protein ASJ81_08325 [Methanosarcina spelaei]|uniref:Schlafen AlbA-2 domain-containing protein n=1 Tax=Methanosarcina spelaei TaxID=1036679 RepID=A0A2A2HRM3_9EURY|nr:ATP-binding protein [Methanosarcina spelaei]PAV11950.1 hypothetical protein ASJ81_08325 [Methanosarcina spelaei]
MLFSKPVSEIDFSDINQLKDDQIEESEILDYKEKIDDDNIILKEVVAFSNSRGGYLVCGVKESGRKGSNRGSYPEAITGIDGSYNYERLEQLIIGNITPRVSVQFKKVPIPDSDRIILIIHIPEGQNKPYYFSRGNRYFKRYNFEAAPMAEHEIEAMYRERFFGVSNLSRYISEAVSFNRVFIPIEKRSKIIDCHIIVSPLRIEERIIDATDGMRISNELRKSMVKITHSPQYLYGSEEPSKYGIKWKDRIMNSVVEIHRNGLIYSMKKCGDFDDDENILMLSEYTFGYNLLNSILFADSVYSMFNFAGRVKIDGQFVSN